MTREQVELLLHRFGGCERVEAFIRGGLVLRKRKRLWSKTGEEERTLYLTSTGMNAAAWERSFAGWEARDMKVSVELIKQLRSFQWTNGVTYEVKILSCRDKNVPDVGERLRIIRERAREQALLPLNLEGAALLYDALREPDRGKSVSKMGFVSILCMGTDDQNTLPVIAYCDEGYLFEIHDDVLTTHLMYYTGFAYLSSIIPPYPER